MAGDFTSALYLGFRHPPRDLKPWRTLTTGKPAALETPAEHAVAALAVARLQACESGVFATSTLHLFWDLFTSLAGRNTLICLDEGAYSVVRWGVERAACRGVRVAAFRHYDANSLASLIRRESGGKRPLVVADGVCPACGATAPLGPFLEIVNHHGGLLVLDDTQGIGLMGEMPERSNPFGRGGGGTLRRHGATGDNILVASSLAKGFGVPVAVLAGPKALVERFSSRSGTRVHCSPPSSAVVSAAEHALSLNLVRGDLLRRHLASLVSTFRSGVAEIGLRATGRLFPVQTLIPLPGLNFPSIHPRLLKNGIRTVLQKSRRDSGPRLSFIITADKTNSEIQRAVEVLEMAVYGRQERSFHDMGGNHASSFHPTARIR